MIPTCASLPLRIHRPRWNRFLAALCAAAGALIGASPAPAIQLPPGFVSQAVPFTFDVPTAIDFLPGGGLLVAEKGGIVYVVRGAQRWPLWVHEEEVLNTDDRGLLGIAVDPNFAVNRRLYFLYTVDPDSNGIELDNYDDAFARLVRYEVSATDSNVVDESTRTVLIGATWSQGFPSGSGTHTVADLAWGADGSLFVSAGDGAHFEQMDAGGLDPGLFTAGRTDPVEDIGAFRAQDLGSMDGKVLRIDPATGLGYPSNPYYDGNPASHRSRVWSYGLRNPFRIARRPGTGSPDPTTGDPGTLYIGEVGWNTWEEVDVARIPGANFGWPCFEGPAPDSSYQAASPAHHGCGTLGTAENPAPAIGPIAAFHHLQASLSLPPGTRGRVVGGGVFHTGPGYPAPYGDGYFFGDYMRNWIKVLKTDANDQMVALLDFATAADGPVCFATDPASGDLYYVSIYTGEVRRIRYTGVAAAPPVGEAPLALSAPTPNPTRGATAMSLDLASPERVRFAVFDVAGHEVWRAPDRDLPPGHHAVFWPALAPDGRAVPAGIYLVRVEAGGRQWTRRLAVLR
jgi:glucose/arabinose dehydrogenase